jgi:NFU1 iron-sulfur cluster scaffold homolog, mitochondrial
MIEKQLKITAEPTMDSEICKFIIDLDIVPGREVSCKSREMAAGSPLLEALFAIDAIREVLVFGNSITIAKTGSESWSTLGKQIGTVIREVIQSGKSPIPSEWENKAPDKGHIYKEVEQILASRVNPGVSTHGGHVELIDVKGTAVYLRLSGGCQGCGAANVTLRQGIEKAIRSRIPEVTEVIDITDHTSGKNPFYKTRRSDGSPL